MDKDYYKILGVNESDSTEQIKFAYRKLARKWHPDIAGNSAEVLSKFKKLNEAYSVLSNKVKKSEYDRMRTFYNYAKSGSKAEETRNYNSKSEHITKTSSSNPQKKFNFDWNEFINNKNNKSEKKATPINGDNIYTEVEISIQEAITGTEKVINILQTSLCPKCEGRKFVNGGLCKCCNGKGENTSHKKFSIKIPAGIKDCSKIRLHGEGGIGQHGGQNGDLYVTVRIKEENDCQLEGLNVIKKVPITPYEAVLGGIIEINSIGGNFSVKIAPNTQNGQKIRLSGCGIVQNDKIVDMIIILEIKIPKNLTNEEVNLYKKLADVASKNIRDNVYGR
jgi:molecular chaperone DnaJ